MGQAIVSQAQDTQKPIITSLSHAEAEAEARADIFGVFHRDFLFFSGECVVKRERD